MSETKYAVHCPTQESYDRLMKAYKKKGWDKYVKGYKNNDFPVRVGFADMFLHYSSSTIGLGYKIITVDEALAKLGQYERGQKVLVSNDNNKWEQKIYLTTIEGSYKPYICVCCGNEYYFNNGDKFEIFERKYIKPLEEPIKEMTMQEVETALGYKFKLIK